MNAPGASGNLVFLYLRGDGLDRQETACREYCAQNGLTIADLFRETSNGMDWRHWSVFMAMRGRYLNGEVYGVVVTGPSRLSRDTVQLFALVQEMTEHRVALLCAEAAGGDTIPADATAGKHDAAWQRAQIAAMLRADMPQADIVSFEEA